MVKQMEELRKIPCPVCKQHTDISVAEDTVLYRFPLFCTHCGREYRISVVRFKTLISDGNVD